MTTKNITSAINYLFNAADRVGGPNSLVALAATTPDVAAWNAATGQNAASLTNAAAKYNQIKNFLKAARRNPADPNRYTTLSAQQVRDFANAVWGNLKLPRQVAFGPREAISRNWISRNSDRWVHSLTVNRPVYSSRDDYSYCVRTPATPYVLSGNVARILSELEQMRNELYALFASSTPSGFAAAYPFFATAFKFQITVTLSTLQHPTGSIFVAATNPNYALVDIMRKIQGLADLAVATFSHEENEVQEEISEIHTDQEELAGLCAAAYVEELTLSLSRIDVSAPESFQVNGPLAQVPNLP